MPDQKPDPSTILVSVAWFNDAMRHLQGTGIGQLIAAGSKHVAEYEALHAEPDAPKPPAKRKPRTRKRKA